MFRTFALIVVFVLSQTVANCQYELKKVRGTVSLNDSVELKGWILLMPLKRFESPKAVTYFSDSNSTIGITYAPRQINGFSIDGGDIYLSLDSNYICDANPALPSSRDSFFVKAVVQDKYSYYIYGHGNHDDHIISFFKDTTIWCYFLPLSVPQIGRSPKAFPGYMQNQLLSIWAEMPLNEKWKQYLKMKIKTADSGNVKSVIKDMNLADWESSPDLPVAGSDQDDREYFSLSTGILGAQQKLQFPNYAELVKGNMWGGFAAIEHVMSGFGAGIIIRIRFETALTSHRFPNFKYSNFEYGGSVNGNWPFRRHQIMYFGIGVKGILNRWSLNARELIRDRAWKDEMNDKYQAMTFRFGLIFPKPNLEIGFEGNLVGHISEELGRMVNPSGIRLSISKHFDFFVDRKFKLRKGSIWKY